MLGYTHHFTVTDCVLRTVWVNRNLTVVEHLINAQIDLDSGEVFAVKAPQNLFADLMFTGYSIRAIEAQFIVCKVPLKAWVGVDAKERHINDTMLKHIRGLRNAKKHVT